MQSAVRPAPPASMPHTPWTPVTGVTPWARQNISGAQNLSGWSKFPPGHWALRVQKLQLLRFHTCAWVFSANAPGPFSAVGAAHWAAPTGRLATDRNFLPIKNYGFDLRQVYYCFRHIDDFCKFPPKHIRRPRHITDHKFQSQVLTG